MSLGCDTEVADGVGTWELSMGAFAEMGRRAAALKLKTLVVQEGVCVCLFVFASTVPHSSPLMRAVLQVDTISISSEQQLPTFWSRSLALSHTSNDGK